MADEQLDPGLEGFSDSGSDVHELPPPELPPGVRKVLVTSAPMGTTVKKPQTGDEVCVRCNWDQADHLGGPGGGDTLRFVIGKHEVISGLELAVTTMRLGEVARISISPKFAVPEGAQPRGAALSVELELLEWISRTDLFGDGAVIKRTLRRPNDRRRPILGQRCLLVYSHRLDESDVGAAGATATSASLLAVSIPALHYTIGGSAPSTRVPSSPCPASAALAAALAGIGSAQEAPPALAEPALPALLSASVLDSAVLSMKRGEQCEVRCSASLAFAGQVGLPGGLTVDSRIVCELELQEFLESSDVSFERNGTVIKQSLRCRDAWQKCEDAGRCQLMIHWVKDEDRLVAQSRTLEFTIGDGDVCDALECAAAAMRVNEVASVICTDERMSQETLLGLPPVPNREFLVEVTSYQPGPKEGARTDAEKLDFHASRKEAGLELLKRGRYALAAYRFKQAYELLGYIDDYRGILGGAERKERVMALKHACMLNRSLCLLKAGSFQHAVKACDLVLDQEPRNIKALLRRAQSLVSLKDWEEALRSTRAALDVDPSSRDVQRLLAEVMKLRKESDGFVKPLFTKMCSGLGVLPHPLDVD